MFSLGGGKIEVVPTRDEHIPAFYDILRRWPSFWTDKPDVRNLAEFGVWYRSAARDSLTGLDAQGRVVGAAYLDHIVPGHYATVNIFKRRGFLNPRVFARLLKEGLSHWFEKYDLEILLGLSRQKASIRLAKRLGFHRDGKLRHWVRMNDGTWADCAILSITRSEVYGTVR